MNQNRSSFVQGNNPNAGIQNGWNPNNMNQYPQQGYPAVNQQVQYAPQNGNYQTAPLQNNGYNMPQNPYPTPAANGYNASAAGQGTGNYATAQQNQYTGPVQGLGQMPQTGYMPPLNPYQPNTANNPNAYAQTGYTNGYNTQQNYNGYAPNPYTQMGRMPAQNGNTAYQPGGYNAYSNQNQVPLNGGGYVPQQPPIRKQPFVFDDLKLILLCLVLVVLFALGMFAGGLTALKWVFAGIAAVSIAAFWLRPMIDENKRLCFTVVFGVLTLIALIPFASVTSGKTSATVKPAAATAAVSSNGGAASQQAQTVQDQTGTDTAQTGMTVTSQEAATPTPAPNLDSVTTDPLQSFFYFWGVNKTDEMLGLCAPSWQSSVESPKTALFAILANRTPLDYTIEKISGTVDDSSRTVTLTTTIDRNNGKTAVKYRLNVLMVKESGSWYVDPSSLKTFDAVETATPVTETATPQPQTANPNTVLYYNPDGGQKYHLDSNCKSTNPKFLPFKGSFTYSKINESPYASLSPCNVCGAPLR